DPSGAVTGKLFPTGRVRDVLAVPGVGEIEVSIVDAANPLVFCRCEDIGLSGQELPDQVDSNQGLLQRIEAIRAAAGVAIELAGGKGLRCPYRAAADGGIHLCTGAFSWWE